MSKFSYIFFFSTTSRALEKYNCCKLVISCWETLHTKISHNILQVCVEFCSAVPRGVCSNILFVCLNKKIHMLKHNLDYVHISKCRHVGCLHVKRIAGRQQVPLIPVIWQQRCVGVLACWRVGCHHGDTWKRVVRTYVRYGRIYSGVCLNIQWLWLNYVFKLLLR